jgi:hypothetical protein
MGGTAAEIAGVQLFQYELAYSTDDGLLHVGDGVTAGGLYVYTRPRVVTITKLQADSTFNVLLDHAGARVLRVVCDVTDLTANKIFNVNGGGGARGIEPGAYVGQLLTIAFKLSHNDTTGAGHNFRLGFKLTGANFAWTRTTNAFVANPPRGFYTETVYGGGPATYYGDASITLVWDGSSWSEANPFQSFNCATDVFGLAWGQYCNSNGIYSAAGGDQVTNSSVGSLAVGYAFTVNTGNDYSAAFGREHGTTTNLGGLYLLSGYRAKPRLPASRTHGADTGNGVGSMQIADYTYTGASAAGAAATLAAQTKQLTIPPKCVLSFFYQCVAVDNAGAANGYASWAGFVTFYRDAANNSTVAVADSRVVAGVGAALAGATFVIGVDDTNERPTFTGTGVAGKTVSFVLRITSAEVAGGAT